MTSNQITQIKDEGGANRKWRSFRQCNCFERYESALPQADFDHSPKYKFTCKGFPTYGKNLSRPPYSPTLLQYLGTVKSAKVICLRLPLGYFIHLTTEERYRYDFRKAKILLVNELLEYREKGYAVAGSAASLTCEQCAAETMRIVGIQQNTYAASNRWESASFRLPRDAPT